MNDTSEGVARQMDALLAQRSGSDRVRMACEMFDLARRLAVANIRATEPGISEEQLRVRLFERLYGDDLSDEDRERLAAALAPRTTAGVTPHDPPHPCPDRDS